MRYLLIASLLALAVPAAAQTPLELNWKLKQDVFSPDGRAASRPAFTLTNRGPKPLPAAGWAIYFTALHEPRGGSVGSGFRIENVTGSLHRLAPGPGFQGLAPGQSVGIEYGTGLLTNISLAPNGVYAGFDDQPDKVQPVAYSVVPFERAPQPGKDPHVITPEAQFELDTVVKDVPLDALPPVFPTPVSVEKKDGSLALAVEPAITASAELKNEAAFAAEVLKPFFATPKTKRPATPASSLRLELGQVEG